MEWTIKLNSEEGYAEIVTTGIADADSSLKMAKALASTLSEYQVTKILVDHRQIEAVSGAPAAIFDRPKQLQEIEHVHEVKIAEIVRPEHRGHFKFFEVVSSNRGFNLSVFHEYEPALAWLLK